MKKKQKALDLLSNMLVGLSFLYLFWHIFLRDRMA